MRKKVRKCFKNDPVFRWSSLSFFAFFSKIALEIFATERGLYECCFLGSFCLEGKCFLSIWDEILMKSLARRSPKCITLKKPEEYTSMQFLASFFTLLPQLNCTISKYFGFISLADQIWWLGPYWTFWFFAKFSEPREQNGQFQVFPLSKDFQNISQGSDKLVMKWTFLVENEY